MTDRYYIEPSRNGWDITDEGTPIRDTDIVARLNEQDEEIRQLRAERDHSRAAIQRALAACPFCQIKRCRSEAHAWLRGAVETQ